MDSRWCAVETRVHQTGRSSVPSVPPCPHRAAREISALRRLDEVEVGRRKGPAAPCPQPCPRAANSSTYTGIREDGPFRWKSEKTELASCTDRVVGDLARNRTREEKITRSGPIECSTRSIERTD